MNRSFIAFAGVASTALALVLGAQISSSAQIGASRQNRRRRQPKAAASGGWCRSTSTTPPS